MDSLVLQFNLPVTSVSISSVSVGSSITTSSLDHSILGMGRPRTSAGISMGSPFLTVMESPLKTFSMWTSGATENDRTGRRS